MVTDWLQRVRERERACVQGDRCLGRTSVCRTSVASFVLRLKTRLINAVSEVLHCLVPTPSAHCSRVT